MTRSRAQFFLLVTALCLPTMSIFAQLALGRIYPLTFVDVDGNTLSTADGRVTTVVLTTTADVPKAETVGDRTPDNWLGNPNFRMITVVNFQKKRRAATRVILRALVRRRLDAEAQRLQLRYAAKNIARNARQDVIAVADFDGSIVAQLGSRFEAADFRVFVFGQDGKLLQQWNDVPSTEELAAVVK